MWRCVNDYWGYCADAPSWKREPDMAGVKGEECPVRGVCKLQPVDCEAHRTFAQLVPKPKKNKSLTTK